LIPSVPKTYNPRTAEKGAFSAEQYATLVALASNAMQALFARQREALERARR
jgi:ribonuclease PH